MAGAAPEGSPKGSDARPKRRFPGFASCGDFILVILGPTENGLLGMIHVLFKQIQVLLRKANLLS